MAVILGYKIADSWSTYCYHSGTVRKWWRCPRCSQDFLFRFLGGDDALQPPLDVACPSCEQESPIPWPSSTVVTCRCERCGTNQQVSSSAWHSRDKKCWDVVSGDFEAASELRCEVCDESLSGNRPTLGDAAGRFASAPLSCTLRCIGHLIDDFRGLNEKIYAQSREGIEKATREVDSFLSKVPQIRAEQTRHVEKEKQRVALETKKREEELRLIKKQASTATGLKRMKPINFELAVASLY